MATHTHENKASTTVQIQLPAPLDPHTHKKCLHLLLLAPLLHFGTSTCEPGISFRRVGRESCKIALEKYSALCRVLQTILIVMVPVSAITVSFDFLLLPIRWSLSWLISGVLLAVGIYVFVLSKREFDRSGQKLTPKAYGTSRLMTSGIYSSVRHPHNLANMLLSLGIAFGFKSAMGLVIAMTFIMLGYWFTLEEEELLIEQFGDRYREYKARVPMFVPRLRRTG
jgi:protein-S-isoprenylcysteine O-methyltransferase Ste14